MNVPTALWEVVHVLNNVRVPKTGQTKLADEAMVAVGTWKRQGSQPVIWEVVWGACESTASAIADQCLALQYIDVRFTLGVRGGRTGTKPEAAMRSSVAWWKVRNAGEAVLTRRERGVAGTGGRARVESLEQRSLLAAISWDGGGDQGHRI